MRYIFCCFLAAPDEKARIILKTTLQNAECQLAYSVMHVVDHILHMGEG